MTTYYPPDDVSDVWATQARDYLDAMGVPREKPAPHLPAVFACGCVVGIYTGEICERHRRLLGGGANPLKGSPTP